MIQITSDPIDNAAVLDHVASNRAGAVVLFVGTTREFTGDRQTESLDYECYGDMAQKKMAELEAQAHERWQIIGCAIVHRVGRLDPGDRQTESLDYECYGDMAQKKMAELEAQAHERWQIIGCAIVHRVGRLDPGEASVAIAVSSPHRGDAFEAGKWLIDALKEIVPIWKKENWSDGTSQWVHPGMEEAAT